MRDFSQGHEWLSINTATVRMSKGKAFPLDRIIDACARRNIRAFSPWRDQVSATGINNVAKLVRDNGLSLSGYCRGGMFTYSDNKGHQAASEDNRRAVDEAAQLGATCLVLVVGGLPGALSGKAAHTDIALSRQQVHDGIGELLDYARTMGIPLAIEPLHPMYAADRSCVNTMQHALDICDVLDPHHSGSIGVAVDVYHVWWDPTLQQQIERAGSKRLLAFHVCDWLTPTKDFLNDRGMMGDGVIDIPMIRGWMEAQGYDGFSEVEIFSSGNWWQCDAETTLDVCVERHRDRV
jgi:sugar phosphate isomerase/epimerase